MHGWGECTVVLCGMWNVGYLRCIVGCWYFEYVKERKEILSKDVWELFVKE